MRFLARILAHEVTLCGCVMFRCAANFPHWESAAGQTLQGIHRQTGPEVRFGPKADLISMLIPGGSCFSPL